MSGSYRILSRLELTARLTYTTHVSLMPMATGDSLLSDLFLVNRSTDADRQHYLCSTTKDFGSKYQITFA